MAKIGYARVSTTSQDLSPQIKALNDAGAEEILQDKKSGKDMDREGIKELMNKLQSGDTLIVTKMDRIARNVRQGLELIEELEDRGIELRVLNMPELSGGTGKLVRTILFAVAEWERELILERQREGIELAKQNGKYKTKPKLYTDKNPKLLHALDLFANRASNGMTVKDICKITEITRSSLYAIAKEKGIT